MASRNKKDQGVVSENKTIQIIDPIYEKFVKSVLRALSGTDFYEFFMDSLSRADNEFQFSNRRMEKIVDLEWVDAVEEALEGFQNIVSTPRNFIKEEELVVNVAQAKKAGSDVVRHLSTHAALVDDFNEDSGNVRPNKLMQKYREDSIELYENKLVFTTLEMAYQFVKIRHDALFQAMSDEFGAKLKLRSDMASATETVHLDMFLHIKDIDSALETDDKNREVFERISRIYRILSSFMNTQFALQLSKLPRIKGAITKTNALKKNPNYRKIVKLLEYLRGYGDIGYTIKIIEQNPAIDENFTRDIYHNILFNYLVLKGHLERDKDRALPAPTKEKKRTLRPKFIKEIIEELTEDYDLPELEIRKVLIEELTKEQLMKEEAEERRRLVEEQAQRKREEAEREKREKEAERERIRQEKELERERIRQEKAAEEQRLLAERMEREQEDRRRSRLFRAEINYFTENLERLLEARAEALDKEESIKNDFEDAAWILEETERLKREEAERERIRRREERERQMREAMLAREQALKEEAERKEQERLAKLAEEERLRREEEARIAEELRIQQEKDIVAVEVYSREIQYFMKMLSSRAELRRETDAIYKRKK
ncbi:MAG: hypothetical protein IKM46_02320 [Clostridia bacterium]|nr:hypothetical protein [Clostridia bacterium]